MQLPASNQKLAKNSYSMYLAYNFIAIVIQAMLAVLVFIGIVLIDLIVKFLVVLVTTVAVSYVISEYFIERHTRLPAVLVLIPAFVLMVLFSNN